MIHVEEDGTFSLTRGEKWLPGRFENQGTAEYADECEFSEADLRNLQDRKNLENSGVDAVITYADLRELRESIK